MTHVEALRALRERWAKANKQGHLSVLDCMLDLDALLADAVEEEGASTWKGPSRCEKCGRVADKRTPGYSKYCPEPCGGKLIPYDRRVDDGGLRDAWSDLIKEFDESGDEKWHGYDVATRLGSALSAALTRPRPDDEGMVLALARETDRFLATVTNTRLDSGWGSASEAWKSDCIREARRIWAIVKGEVK